MVAVIWTCWQASKYGDDVDSFIALSRGAMRSLFAPILRRAIRLALCSGLVAALNACGAAPAELAMRDRAIDELRIGLQNSRDEHRSETEKRIAAGTEIGALRAVIEGECALGLARLPACDVLARDALARAGHLNELRHRLQQFRETFEAIGDAQGVSVSLRRGRLVLSLSAELVFDPGSVELRKGGKDALRVIGQRIRGSDALSARSLLIAGHTDNSPYPPELPFRDNWGLSLARARQVLLFLVGAAVRPTDGPQPSELGGGLDPHRVAAVGYADTDPVAGTVDLQSREEQQKNRRVEIILDPAADELLDLTVAP